LATAVSGRISGDLAGDCGPADRAFGPVFYAAEILYGGNLRSRDNEGITVPLSELRSVWKALSFPPFDQQVVIREAGSSRWTIKMLRGHGVRLVVKRDCWEQAFSRWRNLRDAAIASSSVLRVG
jgi:hypothetical protein